MKSLFKMFIFISSLFAIAHYISQPLDAIELKPDRENYVSHTKFNGGQKEVKFQLSFKSPIYKISDFTLSGSYTQKSYWQVYDESNSRPFRETNYNPQIYFSYEPTELIAYKIGYWHESNGGKNRYDKYGNLSKYSRSWDRYYGEIEYEFDKFKIRASVWDVFQSEHPDIEKTAGFGQVYFRYDLYGFHTSIELSKAHKEFSIKLPNLISKSVNLSYSFRSGKIDSLIDWDKDIDRHMFKINFGGE